MSMPPRTASDTASSRSRSSRGSYSSTQTADFEQEARLREDRDARRMARQTWTATGALRKPSAPVHKPLKPLEPIAKLEQLARAVA